MKDPRLGCSATLFWALVILFILGILHLSGTLAFSQMLAYIVP